MTHKSEKSEKDLDQAISALRNDEPGSNHLEAAAGRVWSKLQASDAGSVEVEQIRGCADFRALLPAYAAGKLSPARTLLVDDHLRECVHCHTLAQSGSEPAVSWTVPMPAAGLTFRRFAMAAAAVVVLGVSALLTTQWYFSAPAGPRARVQSVNGKLLRVAATGERLLTAGAELSDGEVIRTAGGSGAFVQLRDGSIVEMSERAEFSVSARRNDTTVHLDQGRIIVQAAKRRNGHLYVVTPDCRVAVTGTVFSVNAALKGSRVAVIEGAVHVVYASMDTVLHPGDETATSASMSPVPVEQEISWSQNLDKHLALLAEFAKLQKKFEQIPTPGLRYTSSILGHMPANTILYGSIPNLGEALSEANRIFQDQLAQSAVLREWWTSGRRQPTNGPTFEQMVDKLHTFSQYIGDEVVIVALSGHPAGESGAAIVAEVRRPGLHDFLQNEFSLLAAQAEKPTQFRVLDEGQLKSMVPSTDHPMLAVVGENYVLFSESVSTLQFLDAQLNSGGGFAGTDFGHAVSDAYGRGAGFLLAVNLQQIMAESHRQAGTAATGESHQAAFQQTGLADARYLIAEHRDLSGTPDNRAVVEFAGQRHGIASWLAKPAPIGSLDFVSANASAAFSFVSKDPAGMLDDIMQMAAASGKDPQKGMTEFQSELNLNLRDDLLAALGGDATLALDGPVLPKPSWKLIVEVYDPARLQNAIPVLVQAINNKAAQHDRPGVQLDQQEVDGQMYYVLHALDPKAPTPDVHYTFSDGYMVVAPTRALLISALSTKQNGNSLAHSDNFKALLPKGPNEDVSAVLYQNVGPLLQPLSGVLTAPQMQSLQEIAANSKPSVICAFGQDSRIEVASSSRLLPFDLNSMAFRALLGARERGTSQVPNP